MGCQTPRIECVPDGDEHPHSDAAVELVAAAGIVLDPWQEHVFRRSLLQTGSRWSAFAVAVCAPRQNGKNGILEARELAGPLVLGERLLIHSAHLADTSKEAFRRLDELLEANEWLSKEVRHIWRTNGHEAIEFQDGARIRFRTRTKGGGRGFSGDCVIFDEAMILPEASMGAILPVVSAQPNPQIWYTGSAVDQTVHDDGLVFSRVRQRALAGDDPRLAYFEWSADAANPFDVDDETARDPETVAQANPALGIRISLEYVEAERRELDPRTFAVERLGVGDWPDPDGTSAVIDMTKWQALTDPASEPVGPVCFAYDVGPDRSWSSVAAAGTNADGHRHVEVAARKRGTGWVVEWLADRVRRHDNVGVVCDAAGPAGTLLPELERAGVAVETVTANEHAQACGLLYDAVAQETVRHIGQRELTAALKGAATRPLGDAWAWSRKNSATDITPLVAVTLAHWSASTSTQGGIVWG